MPKNAQKRTKIGTTNCFAPWETINTFSNGSLLLVTMKPAYYFKMIFRFV